MQTPNDVQVPLTERKVDPIEVLQTEPQLGGQGSGAPPRWVVATGQAPHAIAGLDFGTRYTRVAMVAQQVPRLLTDAPLPSDLRISPDGKIHPFSDPSTLGDEDILVTELRSLVGSNWNIDIQSQGPFTAEELLGSYLGTIHSYIQKRAECLVKKCVVTVPATYTSVQRRKFKETANLYDLEILQVINETTAAALYYAYENPEVEENVLLFHLGAGNFAASVASIRNGIVEVKSTCGDANLGGDNFDVAVMEQISKSFEAHFKRKLLPTRPNQQKLKLMAERIKKDLSFSYNAHARLDTREVLKSVLNFEIFHFDFSINRQEFETITAPYFQKTLDGMQQALIDARIDECEIQKVLLIGMPSTMPMISDVLKEQFVNATIHSMSADAAAMGAALQASLLTQSRRDFVIWDVLTEPILIESHGTYQSVVAKGTPLPVTGYHRFRSPDATVNVHVLQGSGLRAIDSTSSLAELTINNCPPTEEDDAKVEVAFNVRHDGTLDYSARHIGLDINLLVNVRDGEPQEFKIRNCMVGGAVRRSFDPVRLNRLARKLGMSVDDALNMLRQLRYSPMSINDGTAIEKLIRSLRKKH